MSLPHEGRPPERAGAAHRVRPLFCILAISLGGGLLAGAACGGSASESPWPVEPDSPVLGPEGEDGKPLSTPLVDAGSDAAPNVEP